MLDCFSPSGERTGFISFGMFALLAGFGESETNGDCNSSKNPKHKQRQGK